MRRERTDRPGLAIAARLVPMACALWVLATTSHSAEPVASPPPAPAQPAAGARSAPAAPTAEVAPAPAAAAAAPQTLPDPVPADPVPAPAASRLPPAKQVFGALSVPAQLEARAIGGYSRGCLAGARALPVDGPAWQAMRLSRNRNWGHPELIALIEKFAIEARDLDGWPGLLVGDISQPRGGPMLTGHASHQIGLDADVWFTPMPDRRLSPKEREDLSATSMLGADQLTVDDKIWTARHVQVVKRAASYPAVERVLVHPGIKKALCSAAGTDRAWLAKVRPYWGHHYHFHIRLGCPAGSVGCVSQKPPSGDDGCDKELVDWFALLTKPAAPKPLKPPKPAPEITLDDLPAECKLVVEVGIARPADPEPVAPEPAARASRTLLPSSAKAARQ